MTTGPIAAFALGSLAVSRGASETAALASAVCNPSVTSVNTADLNAILTENAYLRAQNEALKADVLAFKTYAKKLEVWGDGVLARLKAKSGQ